MLKKLDREDRGLNKRETSLMGSNAGRKWLWSTSLTDTHRTTHTHTYSHQPSLLLPHLLLSLIHSLTLCDALLHSSVPGAARKAAETHKSKLKCSTECFLDMMHGSTRCSLAPLPRSQVCRDLVRKRYSQHQVLSNFFFFTQVPPYSTEWGAWLKNDSVVAVSRGMVTGFKLYWGFWRSRKSTKPLISSVITFLRCEKMQKNPPQNAKKILQVMRSVK